MKRRDFLINGGLAIPGAMYATSTIGLNSFTAANETINFGIIGTGDRGGGLIPIINEIPGFRVVACCDIIPFRLDKALAKVEGKAKGYKEYRKLLDQKSIDAVLIATPFSTHAQIALDALDAGKHVFCEKTLAKGYDAVEDLVKASKKSKTIFQTGHQYHSSRLYTHIVEQIKEGKIGNHHGF